MKQIVRTVLLILAAVFSIGLGASTAAVGLTPQQILEKADSSLSPDNFTAKVQLEREKPGEDKKTYTMSIYNRGGDKTRIEFIAPPVEKGRKMLRRGDEMWMYLPSAKRPIKVAAKQDFMGSNFSNGNMIRLKLTEDYTAVLENETKSEYVLLLTAKDPSVAYDKVRMWVDKSTLLPTRQEYYTVSGKLLKICEYSGVKTFGATSRPSVMTMTSTLDKGRSVVNIMDMKVGSTLPESSFTVGSLK